MGDDRGDADPQHAPGVPDTGTVHGHIADLVRHTRRQNDTAQENRADQDAGALAPKSTRLWIKLHSKCPSITFRLGGMAKNPLAGIRRFGAATFRHSGH